MFVRWFTLLGLVGGMALADSPDRQALIRQVEAADVLARWLEQHPAPAQRPPSTQPATRLAYDQVVKITMEALPASSTEPPDLAELNDYQLRQAIATLQLHNIQAYVQLNHTPLASADGRDVFSSPDRIADAVVRSQPPATQPTRSAALAQYLAPPEQVVRTTMNNVSEASTRQDSVEAPESSRMNPSQLVAAVLRGDSVRRTFGIPSSIAPTDLRAPGTAAIAPSQDRTLPLSSDVPGTLALRADPPGTPSELIPSPEEISRLTSALGVSPAVAEQLATGRITLSEALQGKSSSNSDSGTGNPLLPNDPRFSAFYFGPEVGNRNWRLYDEDSFDFRPGGGQYVRSDTRLNSASDTRTNGQLDRRVNVNADRRTNVQNDPRVNLP